MSDPASSLHDLTNDALPLGWRRLRLTLEWDGTGFNGWQVQSQGERTIQGALETALEPLGAQSSDGRRAHGRWCSRLRDARSR